MWNAIRMRDVVLGALLLFTAVGCSQWAAPDVSPFANDPLPRRKGITAPVIHTVKFEGETLSIISQWYTGSVRNWRILAQINSEVEPFHIPIGQQIIIPPSLVSRSDPLPRLFVRRFYESGKTITIKPKKEAPKEDLRPVVATQPVAPPQSGKPSKPQPIKPMPSPDPSEIAQKTEPVVGGVTQQAVPPTFESTDEEGDPQPYFLPSSPELEPVGPKL